MKLMLSAILLLLVIGGSFYFYHLAQTQPTYVGLPTVPCIDYTKPVVQSFQFSIQITIYGKNYPLEKNIGHDYGNCLHDIFTKDASGIVYVHANDTENFTLGQFFDVWKKTFSQKQIFSYQTNGTHKITVFVNGKEVSTYRSTPLTLNANILIRYQ